MGEGQAVVHDFDVIVIGAGLSGIGAAWHLQTRCPDRSYAILEGRDAIGGTWDLFKYPGIRSDSDMYTLGYRFRPWRDAKAIADGPAIKAYIEDTAREYGIDQKIRFRHRVVRAEWSSAEARWTLHAEVGLDRTPVQFTCGFLYACTGYYDYHRGYRPEWPNLADYRGRLVHPQEWPEDLDYAGKRVVVIGSGATAVTLVPAMVQGPNAAARVTMLQRSPSYVAMLPGRDKLANALRKVLPERAVYATIRWKNVFRSLVYYTLARRKPAFFTGLLHKGAAGVLGPDYDLRTHFTPSYAPWDQRLCIAPDADLFLAIRGGRAEVVTDSIASFTESGIRLGSGAQLDADIVVTATGLRMQLFPGLALGVDGKPVDLSQAMAYKGMMFSGVPNLANSLGYTNASWTLRSDLIAEHVCRLLNYMKRKGYAQVTPRRDPAVLEEPVLSFSSGYVQRALPSLPKQGSRAPWRVHQNYLRDLVILRMRRVDDPALEFRAKL